MEVFLLIIEDRHSDVGVQPYRTEAAAQEGLREFVNGLPAYITDHPEDLDMELTDGMRAGGWVAYLRYSPEGDCVRIVQATMPDD